MKVRSLEGSLKVQVSGGSSPCEHWAPKFNVLGAKSTKVVLQLHKGVSQNRGIYLTLLPSPNKES